MVKKRLTGLRSGVVEIPVERPLDVELGQLELSLVPHRRSGLAGRHFTQLCGALIVYPVLCVLPAVFILFYFNLSFEDGDFSLQNNQPEQKD
jgi:hypothetical protein